MLDYDGPVDLKLSVRGYSPKRRGAAPSHVLVKELRRPRLDRGPRAIKLREDHDCIKLREDHD